MLQTPRDRLGVVVRAQVLLTDPREQEHLVVHGQPEQDRELEQRHERVDEPDVGEAQDALEVALLEHEHHQPVGGDHRREVHEQRLDRQQQAPEEQQQDEEREQQHQADHPRELVLQLVVEVGVQSGVAPYPRGGGPPEDGLRIVAEPEHERVGLRGLGAVPADHLDQRLLITDTKVFVPFAATIAPAACRESGEPANACACCSVWPGTSVAIESTRRTSGSRCAV